MDQKFTLGGKTDTAYYWGGSCYGMLVPMMLFVTLATGSCYSTHYYESRSNLVWCWLVWFELLGKADIAISNIVGGPSSNEEVWLGRLQ